MKKFSIRWLLFLTAIVAAVTALASLPKTASLAFPIDRRDSILDCCSAQGISDELNRFSANNVSTFNGTSGWNIWLSEQTILDDAQANNYFCIIEYQSMLGQTWKRSFLNGMCGHNRVYTNCLDCQSVTWP